jgi:hypothetical protein
MANVSKKGLFLNPKNPNHIKLFHITASFPTFGLFDSYSADLCAMSTAGFAENELFFGSY